MYLYCNCSTQELLGVPQWAGCQKIKLRSNDPNIKYQDLDFYFIF